VEKGDNRLVVAGPNCPRISNGYQISGHCDQGMQQFKWPVENRRWIADTETGVAFGECFRYWDYVHGEAGMC